MKPSMPPTGDKRALARRLKEARIGDVRAQYDVALMYANGAGVAKNPAQAFHWTQTAAERGYVPAQYLLGCAYAAGQGTDRDELKAFQWLVKAYVAGFGKASFRLAKLLSGQSGKVPFGLALEVSEQGNVDAMLYVAECYAEGLGVPRDNEAARHLYAVAAQAGHAQAQFELGRMLLDEVEAPKDESTARSWMRRAARQGHPGARLALEALDERIDQPAQSMSSVPPFGGKERRNQDGQWAKYVQQHGRARDAFDLGVMYAQGVGVERNVRQARAWYRRAADMGLADGQYHVGLQRQSVDPMEATDWFRRAAEQGHVQAQLALAEVFENVDEAAATTTEGLYWTTRAALAGNPAALYRLWDETRGQNMRAHDTLLEQAATKGHASAQFDMGERCVSGLANARDWAAAFRWYEAAALQGHAQAQCALGDCYASGQGTRQDKRKAFSWYALAAEQNIPRAMWNLGEMYAQGLPGIEADAKKAASLCKRAANAGFAPARSTLGALFAKAGRFDRATHWWSLAAKQGDLEATFNLAQCCRSGKGVARDMEVAFELFLRAAEGGLRTAQSRVGLAFATGEGVAVDLVEACRWFELAAERGDAAAIANRDRARKMLSPAQYKEVLRRLRARANFMN